MVSGRYCHGEVSSADASAGVDATLVGIDGAAIVLAAGEQVIVKSLNIHIVAAGAYSLTKHGTGSKIVAGTVPANTRVFQEYDDGVPCGKGNVPTLKAAAGQVDLQFEAVIRSA